MATTLANGIDVSHNNGTIDWDAVQASSPTKSFVFIKATEGVGYVDPMCQKNATAVAQKTNLLFGYYHFASLNNATNVSKDATDEANWFVQTLRGMPEATLIPVLDIERNDSKLTQQQVQEWISAFLAEMETLGFPRVLLYSSVSFFNENLPSNHPFGHLPLWIAHYTSNPSPSLPKGWTEYTLWQYSASGSVKGISTSCDLDKGDSDALEGLRAAQPTPRSYKPPVAEVPVQAPASPPAANAVRATTSESAANVPTPPAIPVDAPVSSLARDTRDFFQPHDESGNAKRISVRKKKTRRFVFFGLKIGHLIFIGLMYGRPDAEMQDAEE